MKQLVRSCVPGLVVSLALLSACGTGGEVGDPPPQSSEPAFVVPPQPTSLRDRSGLNQKPPERLMSEQIAPMVAKRPEPLARDERAAAEANALDEARTYLTANGLRPENDVEIVDVLQDPYGGIHVKMRQTYRGVPMLGTGFICHTHPERPDWNTVHIEHGHGVQLEVRPVITESEARADARQRYGDQVANTEITARLVIEREHELVKVRNLGAPDNTDDFERRLVLPRLGWEVLVAPVMPDPEDVILALLGQGPETNDTDDASTDLARRENDVRDERGLIPSDHGADDHLAEALANPAIRYLFDAQTGDLISEHVLIEHLDYVPSQGTGHGWYNGTVPVAIAYDNDSGNQILMDIQRPDVGTGAFPIGSWVLDAGNVDTHDAAEMTWITDENNIWGDGSITDTEGSALDSARRQTPAVDVAHGIQATWDFLDLVLATWGPDTNGSPTRACVHWGDGYPDAHFNPSSGFICFGDGGETTSAGNYRLKTVAHELGHVFWHGVGIEGGTGEAGALNEGGADILGGLVALWRTTGAGTGNQVRRSSNFTDWMWRAVDPSTYPGSGPNAGTGQFYWSSGLEDLSAHVGGCAYGRVMIFLAEGAPGDPANSRYTTEFPNGLGGIGPTFAAQVWHYATAYCVAGTPSFASMRDAWIEAAEFLYPNTMIPAAVRRAWAAIRVGSSVADTEPPEFLFAQVFEVDPKDMTAAIFALPQDDTGFRQLRVDGHGNDGVYRGDIFLGYANIARAPIGTNEFTFEIEDSDGKTTSITRSFVKPHDRNLIVNGDFEDDMVGWTTASGDDRVWGSTPARTFIGQFRATMEGDDTLWQEVTVPPEAENVSLVFRLLVRDDTVADETLRVEVQNTLGTTLQVLAAYDVDNPPDTRNWINKGYLRQEFDLSDYAGLTVRIAFVNATGEDRYQFQIDQVVMSYEEDLLVGMPQVALAEWDDTVSFTLPDIAGAQPGEIKRVDWYIDNVFVGAGPDGETDWYGSYFLSSLTPGPHWVAGRIIGQDDAVLADTWAVWFEPEAVNELLVNGDFEDGAWDLTFSDPAPKVQVVPNASFDVVPFGGQNALKLGGLGANDTTTAGQLVAIPQQMASLTFSVRVRIVSDEGFPLIQPLDSLWLELWDNDTFTQIGQYQLATWLFDPPHQGSTHLWRDHMRLEVPIPPSSVAGKNVVVRLVSRENAIAPTWFYVDNASLRYTLFGLFGNSGG